MMRTQMSISHSLFDRKQGNGKSKGVVTVAVTEKTTPLRRGSERSDRGCSPRGLIQYITHDIECYTGKHVKFYNGIFPFSIF